MLPCPAGGSSPGNRARGHVLDQFAGGAELGRRHRGKAALAPRRARRGGRCRGRRLGGGRFLRAVVPLVQRKAAFAAAGGRQRRAHRTVDGVEDITLAREADLGLGRVDVDVHELGRHIQPQHRARELALHHGSFVGVFQRSHHRAVLTYRPLTKKCCAPRLARQARGGVMRPLTRYTPLLPSTSNKSRANSRPSTA